ncbi:hypothetical protein [Riemerella columbipharyngis]|uniref:Uncharacterized protein n=1 Tax=Riemerella columbipharyngis TaxID=1071918 RepID=A0A1G6ZFW5_9FLAO|nr:hypothetical protein [Riemerella columbipharyngis]SDE01528.1 hypothetical protein SAMN05421544_10273 [Riemerella columbipharyngis]
MKKISFSAALLLAITFSFSVAAHNRNNDSKIEISTALNLPVSGVYEWDFEIPGLGTEKSTITFSNTIVLQEMKGKAYNTKYRMKVVSYDSKTKKIVLEGVDSKKGKYYAMFLKDITSKSTMIYKAEFETKSDADKFARPADDNKENHGWNIYTKK